MKYFHSVSLDEEKCRGCTNCIKHCPTQAIRVRDGKARINSGRCIDCGECIRICENHAKRAVTDTLDVLNRFTHPVALVAPSFFAQFRGDFPPGRILGAFLSIGFREVVEVAEGAEYVSAATRIMREGYDGPKPLISSACPAVVRLIEVRFPGLLDQVAALEAPVDTAAKLYRCRRAEAGLSMEGVGLFFITPCPAKVTAAKERIEAGHSGLDGCLAMADIFGPLKKALGHPDTPELPVAAGGLGLGWGRAGGENLALAGHNLLAVDGIHNVSTVLEEIELGKLSDVDFLEANACVGGCVGGPLTVENPFVARVKLRRLSESIGDELPQRVRDEAAELMRQGFFDAPMPFLARPSLVLDPDMEAAIGKANRIEETLAILPGLDCGACGCPTCRALAEDIAQGEASLTDCVIKLREQLAQLAEQLLGLAEKLPPAMGHAPGAEEEGKITDET